jgi:dolichol-phosphate mannosyltransferase
MPLQLWVQAAHAGLRIKEVGVPRLYLDPTRAFGGVLNDAEERLAYYRRVIASAESASACCRHLPGILACCSETGAPGACS